MSGQLHAAQFSLPKQARFAIVAARFNDFVVDGLVRGATDTLRRHGVEAKRIQLVRVPGAFELPVTCRQLAQRGKISAVIALGCVIRGETAHFEYVAGSAASGLTQAALLTGVPMIFGVLTTNTTDQALARAGDDDDNKGAEAALSALEMASVLAALRGQRGKSR
jgi:6,7-dimethyl-8-ribityllumazine synthase